MEDRNEQGLANVGRPIDQVGKCYQRCKLKQFRCNAEKALWFAEDFGLSIISVVVQTAAHQELVLPPRHIPKATTN